MNKALFALFVFSFGINTTFAQKFGYVNTSYVLDQMPDYKEAQAEIDKLSLSWEEEIKKMFQEVEHLEIAYQAEEVLLTEEMKKDRRAVIDRKMQEVKEYQKKVFGFEGLFFLKKKELIKPVQDKIWEAVEKVAKNNRLAIMFDKSGELVMIYTDPIHDYTDYVLEELGLANENEVIKN